MALLLDLEIRARTGGKRSLDDVMRLLWTRFGKRGKGFADDDVQALVEEAGGLDARTRSSIATCAGATRSTPSASLRTVGLQLTATDDDDEDGDEREPWLGVTTREDGDALIVATALDGGPAMQPGLYANDSCSRSTDFASTRRRSRSGWRRRRPGDTARFTIFRRDELREVEVTLGEKPVEKLKIVPARGASDAEKAALRSVARRAVEGRRGLSRPASRRCRGPGSGELRRAAALQALRIPSVPLPRAAVGGEAVLRRAHDERQRRRHLRRLARAGRSRARSRPGWRRPCRRRAAAADRRRCRRCRRRRGSRARRTTILPQLGGGARSTDGSRSAGGSHVDLASCRRRRARCPRDSRSRRRAPVAIAAAITKPMPTALRHGRGPCSRILKATRRFLARCAGVMFGHQRLRRAVALRLEARRIDARLDEVGHDRRRARLGQLQVLLGVAAVVGVPLDAHALDLGMLGQNVGDLVEQLLAVGPELGVVGAEVDRALDDDLVLARASRATSSASCAARPRRSAAGRRRW